MDKASEKLCNILVSEDFNSKISVKMDFGEHLLTSGCLHAST